MVIQKFKANQHGRDFILGDLHGCYGLLMVEMDKVSFDKGKDRIFCVGDLIDRGPDSLKCMELVFESWFHSVLGNHCEMMFCGLLDSCSAEYRCWVINGGQWHLDYLTNDQAETGFLETLRAARGLMPLAFEIETHNNGTVGVVHGDAPQFWNEALIRDLRMSTLWGRKRIDNKDTSIVKDIDKVFVGHTPVEKVVLLGNVCYIDTGGVFNNNLTLMEI